jgi:hypothetical protein
MYTQKRVERYISLSFCPEEEESCVQLIGVDRKKRENEHGPCAILSSTWEEKKPY